MTTITPRPTSLVAFALAVALVAGPVAGQNDDVGIGKSASSGPSEAGSSESVGEIADTLSIAGAVDEAVADDLAASVAVSRSDGGTLDIATVDPDQEFAVVTAAGDVPLSLEIAPGGDAAVQGHGHWEIPLGLEVTLHAAPQAQVSGAFLLVHQHPDGQLPLLSDVLTDGGGVSQVLALGDVGSVDVAKLEQLAHKFGDDLPGLTLTWVFASIDAQGGQHLSAARATASGAPVEILTE